MDLDDIIEDMKKFENKLPWRNYHSGQPLQKGFLRINGAETPIIRAEKNPGLEAWLRGVRCAVLHAGRRRRSAVGGTTQHANVFPLIKWAEKLCAEYDMNVAANDKEAGYMLMEKEVFVNELAKILKTDAYKPMSDAYWKTNDADNIYVKHTQMAENITGQLGLGASMRRSLFVKNFKATANIKLQCKSHKEPGAVRFRNLHAAAR